VTGLAAALWMCDDGDLDASRLVRALADEAESRGAVLFERSAALRLDVSPRGVTVATAAGRVEAREAIVCAGDATLDLLPQLEPVWQRLTVSSATYTVVSPAIPTPSRLLGGRLSWRLEGDVVRAAAVAATADAGALERERDAWMTRHLPAVRGPGGVTGVLASTRDGLPVVGRVGDGPVAVAAGYGDGALAWGPLAAAWSVAALTGSRDVVPAELAPTRRPAGNS
jgi:glycine/D-amino acid oxidase-like deaminating enzyme